jgi:biopolymer transport protein ExbD
VPGQTDEHPVNVVSIDSDGTLRWNGRAVTAALVRQFVAIIPKMKPGNITVLKSDGKAPCAVVAETRRVIDDALGCRPETCAEVVAERGTD